MKLVYMWIEKYETVENQGFNFSPDCKFTFDEKNKNINYEPNLKKTFNLYGDKILDITAIVGQNGSGKTTLAKAIWHECGGLTPPKYESDTDSYSGIKNSSDNRILIFKKNNIGDSTFKYKCFYYYNGDTVEVINDNSNEIKMLNLGSDDYEENFADESSECDITSIYYTSAFDMNIINKRSGINSKSYEFGKITSNSVSPAGNLFFSLSKKKRSYGAKIIGEDSYISIINDYADFEERDLSKTYYNDLAKDVISMKFNYLEQQSFLNKKNDEEIINAKIFDKIKFSIKSFLNGLNENENYNNLASRDMIYLFIKHLILKKQELIRKTGDIQCILLFNVLCEMILFMKIWYNIDILDISKKCNQEETKEKMNAQNIWSFEKSKKILEYLKDDNKNQYLKFWGNNQKNELNFVINLIDRGFLSNENIENSKAEVECLKDEILDYINTYMTTIYHNDIAETAWIVSIKDFIDNYKKITSCQIINSEYGEFSCDEDFLKLINEEMKNEYSFLMRNIYFSNIPMSTGERALISLFSSLYELLLPKSDEGNEYINNKNILLIIDEIDVYLHPRWQQIMLKKILDWIKYEERIKNKFQIIITSHSPIILSDFTNDRVIKLNDLKNETDNSKTFGANITNLYYDNFFMKRGSIGEISKEVITDIINYLNNENSKIIKNDDMAEYVIEQIGEEIVRKKLKSKLYSKKKNYKKNYVKLNSLIENMGVDKVVKILIEKEGEINNDKN